MKKHILQPESGQAILTALFVMSLVSIAVMAMTLQLKLEIQRTALVQTHARHLNYFRQISLYDAFVFLKKLQIHEAIELPIVHQNHFAPEKETVSIEIKDLQGSFNINTLLNFKQYRQTTQIFYRLLGIVAPELTPSKKKHILMAIRILAARRTRLFFNSIEQLGSILGPIYPKIAPHLTALPSSNNYFNALNASPELLQAFYPTLDPDTAEQLSNSRYTLSFKERIQLFSSKELFLKTSPLNTRFIEISMRYKNNHFFKQSMKINPKQLEILSENWFE